MIVHAAGLLLLAVVFGSMVFFAAALTPSIFRLLPIETARPFLRGLFPIYYLYCGALCGVIAGLLLWPPRQMLAGILVLLAALGFVLARRELVPRIDLMRAQGNQAGFEKLHKASVILNTAQMAVIATVFLHQIALASCGL